MEEPIKKPGDVLSENLAQTIEVDPERLKIEHEIDIYENLIESFGLQKIDTSIGEKVLARLCAKLEDYDRKAAVKDQPERIAIRYIPVEDLDQAEAMQRDLQSVTDDKQRLLGSAELDRFVVGKGVVGHRGCCINGQEIPFVENDADVLAFYSRRRWMRALRWAVWNYNTLSEKKKRTDGLHLEASVGLQVRPVLERGNAGEARLPGSLEVSAPQGPDRAAGEDLDLPDPVRAAGRDSSGATVQAGGGQVFNDGAGSDADSVPRGDDVHPVSDSRAGVA
jgi:hypothetical protein